MGDSDRQYDRERTLLVLALLRSIRDRQQPGTRVGWYPSSLLDDSEPEWAIAWGNIPAYYAEREDCIKRVEVGQVSWPIPRDLAERVGWLPQTAPLLDPDALDEQSDRLKRYIGIDR